MAKVLNGYKQIATIPKGDSAPKNKDLGKFDVSGTPKGLNSKRIIKGNSPACQGEFQAMVNRNKAGGKKF